MFATCAKPGNLFPRDVAVFEVAQHVHLTEDAVLVEQQVVVVGVTSFDVVVVLVIDVSQLTSTRRQQTLRLNNTSAVSSSAGLRHVRGVRPNRAAEFRRPPFWTLKIPYKSFCHSLQC